MVGAEVMDRSTRGQDGTALPRVRVGIVGFGVIAQVMHGPYLRELHDRFEVVAVCDVAPEALDFAGRLFPSVRCHARWEDLLQEPLDAVMVLTAGSHAPVAVAAAEAGLHVFVEKPMCFSVAEGEDMVAAAERAGVVLMVGYMKRYDPAYEELERTLDRGEVTFARVTTLESPFAVYARHHPRAAAASIDPALLAGLVAEDERRLDAALGPADPTTRRAYRTVLLDSMIHELNGLRGLLGEPTVLHAVRIAEEAASVVATMDFGPVAAAFLWIDLPGVARYEADWSLYGPDRRASLVFPSPLLRSQPTRLVLEGGDPGGVSSWRTDHTVSYEEAFKRELLELHAAISEGRAARTDGLDGLRDVALSRAIVRCHAEGRPVEAPSEPPRRSAVEPAPA